MPHRLCLSAALLLAATSLAQAAAEPPRIEDAETEDDRLAIEFDQPMLTWRGESDTAGITLAPRVDCRWYWEQDTTLVCQVPRGSAAPIRAATAYRLQVPGGLWSQAGAELAPTALTVVSSRPELELKVTDWHAGQPELWVVSRWMPVTAQDVAQVLELRVDGVLLDYTLAAPTARKLASMYMEEGGSTFKLEPKRWPTSVATLVASTREGLRSSAGPLRGEAQSLLNTQVNQPLRLVGLGCGWSRMPMTPAEAAKWGRDDCAPDAEVSLVFSRRLAKGEAERIAAGLPGLTASNSSVSCRWECGDGRPSFHVGFTAKAAGVRLPIVLPADLRADDGSVLETGPVPELVFRDHPASVRAAPSVRLLRPGSDAALALEVRNLTAPTDLAELATGRRTHLRNSRLPITGITNQVQPWQAAPPRGGIARQGGLTLAGVRASPEPGFAVAVAPFNVIAAADASRVMVWASDWDSAAAIADASIELLRVTSKGKETVLARGRTGADGVGYLPTAQYAWGDEQTQTRLVRVRHAGRQSVIPVLSSWSQLPVEGIPEKEWDSDIYYGGSDTDAVFGVSDRLLYRPGDTVHFRVWSRQRDGNRLRPQPGKAGDEAPLVLRNLESRSAMDAWSGRRDGWGGAAGDRPLSANLADGTYCITRADDSSGGNRPSGACFDVARFDSQAVWVRSAFDRKIVRAGDELALDIEGGFYSGGGAAGARVEATAFLEPTPLGELYPAFARFTFASPLGPDGEESDIDPLATLARVEVLDGRGKARFAGKLPARFVHGDSDGSDESRAVAIGQIRANTFVTIPGAASSASPVATAVYAAHARYVGLRSGDWWLPSNKDPQLEATVVTAEGVAMAAGTVRVRIERDGEGDAAEVLARCELAIGAVAPCAFRAPEPGEYRFVAEADGAAPSVMTRYFYGQGSRDDRDGSAKVELTLLATPEAGGDAVLRLLQPYPRANALFVVEYDNVLRHWVQEVGPDSQVRVAMPREWAPGVSVRVLLRPIGQAPSTGAIDARLPNAVVRVPVARQDTGKVSVAFAPGARAPGEDLVLRLGNGTKSRRLVTLAIVDDSVHQQAAVLHGAMDPNGQRFIGMLESWTGAAWHGFDAWSRVPNLFIRENSGAAPDPQAYAAASSGGYEQDAVSLDTIEVTGSRIKRSDLVDSGVVAGLSAPPREATSAEGPPAARVRSRFPVTAYWNAGEELAPGETRELRVRLPDNLTRWRLVYWTSDDGDSFTLGEETFQSTLPLEIRAGLPTRIFQGDQGSGTVLARVNAEGAAAVTLQVDTEGAGADGQVKAQGVVAPQASLAQRVSLVSDAQGRIALLARASTATTSDALSSAVEVQSRLAPVSITQAGWLEDGPLALSRPDVPRGAMSPVLAVTVAQGTDPWRDGWLRDLRDYPHRCWEQTLSRGMGAAIALASPDSAAAWPDAAEVVAATLRDAPSFVDDEDHYRYFVGGYSEYSELDPILSAHTLRGFQVLDSLGHAVPLAWRDTLREQLGYFAKLSRQDEVDPWEAERVAIAAGALATDGQAVGDEVVRWLWPLREHMSWFGRSELVRAAAANPQHAALAAQGLQELRDAGRQRGARRILEATGDTSMLMGSPLRDQCAITATLFTLDRSPEHLGVRQQWLRGLSDLYAGGTGSLDTQSSVQCLLALRAAGAALDTTGTARVGVTAGLQSTELALAAGEESARWETPLAPTAEVTLTPKGGSDGTLNYSAQVSYVLDQRDAVAQATGLQLQRSYQVMRGGEWRELRSGAVTEGEWLRTTLTVVVPAMRHFVAITDTVPGGLVTRDVRLGGVAGENLQRLADPGSWWFDTRQTGASEVRFYAQQLPPGTHDLHYYTQATHAGRYFAPPAVAELMYGRNSRASTVSNDLQVKPRP